MRRIVPPLFALLLTIGCSGRQPGTVPPSTTNAPATSSEQGDPTVRDVVVRFGRTLDDVSVLSPDAGATMREIWGPLVTPSLLERWIVDPASSPGRKTSSPRPDRLEAESVVREGDTATVEASLVEVSSTRERRSGVEIRLVRVDDRWLIAAFDAVDSDTVAPEGDVAIPTDVESAVGVVEQYYADIDAGRFEVAWRAWGDAGAPGQTFEEFRRGFSGTAEVEVTTGSPSRVEGAAGSRYVRIPVVITATQSDGSAERFEGTYSLRRSVVDGASDAARRWHLHSADIRRID